MPSRANDQSIQHQQINIGRRQFVSAATAAAASASLLATAAAEDRPAAAPQRKIKLGVVGLGNRGGWIAGLFKKHGGYELHAVADYFPDVAQAVGNALGVDQRRRFSGLSGYKKLIASGVEAVAIEDLPYFYAEQAAAAVEAGCHVYMAKPVAVDVPDCLSIGATGKLATQKKLCFLVDYQLPSDPANIEVAARIRAGALGGLAHIQSFGFSGAWPDPPKDRTIENRLRGSVWLSDIALGGDGIVAYDIHIIDGITWVLGRRPVGACGRSRICRPQPHGDRSDCCGVVYEYEDGLLWTHVTQVLSNNADPASLSASFFGLTATARVQYWGKVFVRGGPKHYVGETGSIYDQGAARNIAAFYRNITEGHFDNPTVCRAVDGTLTAILGREAAARRRYLTMDELLQERKKLAVNLSGLKA
jgi:myo-inositol 2-dehydrogenase / D-chiro-inositol 1-dehydrogenase